MSILGGILQRRIPDVHLDESLRILLKIRAWKPQMTVTGIDGLPPCEKAGNVLRPETTIKMSIRIPPTLDAKKACERLK